MLEIDPQSFVWFTPKPKLPVLAISISSSGSLNVNGRALEQIPKRIAIGVRPNGKVLCIKEDPEQGHILPKSGAVKDRNLVDFIVSAGVILPARYLMRKAGDDWLAELQPPAPPKKSVSKKPRRISKAAEMSVRKELGL